MGCSFIILGSIDANEVSKCALLNSSHNSNGIYDMANNLKIIICVRGRELTFFGVFIYMLLKQMIWAVTKKVGTCTNITGWLHLAEREEKKKPTPFCIHTDTMLRADAIQNLFLPQKCLNFTISLIYLNLALKKCIQIRTIMVLSASYQNGFRTLITMRITESILAVILVTFTYKNQFLLLNYVVVSIKFDSHKMRWNSAPVSS